MKRRRLNTSPKVLARAASAGLFSASILYAMVINDSLFRGNYLMPLPFAGLTFIITFIPVWVVYSLHLAGPRRLSGNPDLVRLVGPEQAAILVQLEARGAGA